MHHVPDEIYWDLQYFIAQETYDAPLYNEIIELEWERDGYEAKVKVEYVTERVTGTSFMGDREAWYENILQTFTVTDFKYNGQRTDFDAKRLKPEL